MSGSVETLAELCCDSVSCSLSKESGVTCVRTMRIPVDAVAIVAVARYVTHIGARTGEIDDESHNIKGLERAGA